MSNVSAKRYIILGRTGAGKTVFSFMLLAEQDYDAKPWIIIDYKKDRLFAKLLKSFKGIVKRLHPDDKPPTKPGLYVMQPVLKADDVAVEAFLMACYRKGNIGLYIDEGYAVPQELALDAILTQGRSLDIPVIACYQRPVWMTRFATSQADYVAVFHIKDAPDRKRILEFTGHVTMPGGSIINANTRLPKYHCLWYDTAEDETRVLRPAPPEAEIFARFAARLKPQPSNIKGHII